MGESKRSNEPPLWINRYVEEISSDIWGWHWKRAGVAYVILHNTINDSWSISVKNTKTNKTTLLEERFIGLEAGKVICEQHWGRLKNGH